MIGRFFAGRRRRKARQEVAALLDQAGRGSAPRQLANVARTAAEMLKAAGCDRSDALLRDVEKLHYGALLLERDLERIIDGLNGRPWQPTGFRGALEPAAYETGEQA